MTFGVTPTDLPELLGAIRDQLVRVTGVARHLVFPTLWPEDEVLEKPPGNTFLTVRPLDFAGVAPVVAGAGTFARAYDGRVRVSVYYRMALDSYLRDTDWLSKDPGPLGVWLRVLNALEQFMPTRNNDGVTGLLIEPMRNDPGFRVPDRQLPVTGWHKLESVWEVKFNHRLA